MAFSIKNLQATVKVNSNVVTAPGPINNGDLVETAVNSSARVEIVSDGSVAAVVEHANSEITAVYVPPTYSLTRIYYNNSYRYKLQTPGGYVGIRG